MAHRRKNESDAEYHKRYNAEYYPKYRSWVAANRERVRQTQRRCDIRKANCISVEEYDAKLAAQNNVCDLCKQPFDDTPSGKPCLDHDHETGQLRSFLHVKCNSAIGLLDDDIARCRLAAEYLERHPKAQ